MARVPHLEQCLATGGSPEFVCPPRSSGPGFLGDLAHSTRNLERYPKPEVPKSQVGLLKSLPFS